MSSTQPVGPLVFAWCESFPTTTKGDRNIRSVFSSCAEIYRWSTTITSMFSSSRAVDMPWALADNLNAMLAGLSLGFIHADVACHHTPRALVRQSYARHHVRLVNFFCNGVVCKIPTWYVVTAEDKNAAKPDRAGALAILQLRFNRAATDLHAVPYMTCVNRFAHTDSM